MKGKFIITLIIPFFLVGSMFYREPDSFEKAEKLYSKGKVDDALKIYKKLSDKFAKNGRFQFNWGLLYLKKKKFQDALDHFRLSFSTGEVSQDEVYYNLGKAFEEMKKYNNAVEMYKMALLKNPRNYKAKFNLELLLMRMKKGKGKNSVSKMTVKQGKMKKQSKSAAKKKKKSMNKNQAVLQSLKNRAVKLPPVNQQAPEGRIDKDW